jgi:putative addiction module CopG family antidote
MAALTMNVSLTPELKDFIQRRIRSGFYGNGSDVVRAGLRALAREETAEHYRRFQELVATLPQEPITQEIEREIERSIRSSRAKEKSGSRR